MGPSRSHRQAGSLSTSVLLSRISSSPDGRPDAAYADLRFGNTPPALSWMKLDFCPGCGLPQGGRPSTYDKKPLLGEIAGRSSASSFLQSWFFKVGLSASVPNHPGQSVSKREPAEIRLHREDPFDD